MATSPVNTIDTRVRRDKYRSASFQEILKNALVAMKITDVDQSDNFRIQNPYSSTPTATVQGITAGNQGTYTPAAWTTTDEYLAVTDEVIVSEHIFGHEIAMTQFDIFANRIDMQNYAVAYAIDKFVINNLCEEATGSYSTPAGGFASQNINTIISEISAKFMGYAELYKGIYLVIENTDVPGFFQAQMQSGFNFADAALNNGFFRNYAGVDIYVVRSGTFVDATIGTTTVTNSGHRVAGIKGLATFAFPRGMQYEEKQVSGKTGYEFVTYGWMGFKNWTNKAHLTIDITITA